MTNTASKAQSAASKSAKRWRNSLIAIIVVFILAIGGTIYYGAVALPAQNKANDISACNIFEEGYLKAQLAVVKEETAKDHKPNLQTAVDGYVSNLFHANQIAFKKSAQGGKLNSLLTDVALARMRYSSTVTASPTFPSDLDSAAQAVSSYCQTILPAASPKATSKN